MNAFVWFFVILGLFAASMAVLSFTGLEVPLLTRNLRMNGWIWACNAVACVCWGISANNAVSYRLGGAFGLSGLAFSIVGTLLYLWVTRMERAQG